MGRNRKKPVRQGEVHRFLYFAKCIPVVVQPAQFSEVIFVDHFWRIVIDFD